ncbi:MAG: hypothetical protein KIT11_01975 [Fimbriimonadaceae bacterium]|nr:hypothetical protein [Fimbriimonadaceae bacterium]QYK54861.1 MAG: hypothetical protein KF733_07560 [Fimbriimonadaceae bacterium]
MSYWPVPSEGDGKYLEALQNADPNHGVVYCLMHTVHTRGPSSPLFNRKGKVLVALKSGSVVNRNMTEKCYLDREGHMVGYSFIWPLLTDAPMPEAVWKIEADVPYGSREVPCP